MNNIMRKTTFRLIFIAVLLSIAFLYADNVAERKSSSSKIKLCKISEFDEGTDKVKKIRTKSNSLNVSDHNIIITEEYIFTDRELENYKTGGCGKFDDGLSIGGCEEDDDFTIGGIMGSIIDGIISIIVSHDPNDMIGPDGYGDENYISPEYNLPYTIRFENDPEFATASAQVVTVEQELDANLDIRTLRLGNFGFADYVFEVPDNRISYQTRIDLRDSLEIYLDVVAGFDFSKGVLFWILRSTDPNTGGLPEDPFAGFLAVNDSTGVGEGFVSYSIKANKDIVATDTTIYAEAKIVFDINAPINTPRIFNTIDIEKPVSHVDTCYAVNDSLLIVKWSKEPTLKGSGIKNYSIYFRKNDTPFDVWLSNTVEDSAYFEAEEDGRYEFFSIATSNVNSIESFKTSAEAKIQVGVADTLNFTTEIPNTTIVEDSDLVIEIDSLYQYLDTNREYAELTWKLADNTGLFCSGNNDSLFITPLENWYGIDYLKLIATYKDLSDTTDFVVNVTSVNDAPLVSNLPDVVFPENSIYTLDLKKYVIDVDDSLHTLVWNVDIVDSSAKTIKTNNFEIKPKIAYKNMKKLPITRGKNLRRSNTRVNESIEPADKLKKYLFVFNEQNEYYRPEISNLRSKNESPNSKEKSIADSITVTIDTETHIARFEGANNFNVEDIPFVFSAVDSSGAIGSDTLNVTITPANDFNSAPLAALTGDKTIYIAFANYSDAAEDMKMEFAPSDNLFFKVLNDTGEEVPINTYTSFSYFKYIEDALENYFNTMSNDKLDLTVKILTSSEQNGVWRLQNKDYYETEIQKYQVRAMMMSDLETVISTNSDYATYINQDKLENETVFINYILPDFDEETGYIRGNNTETQLEADVTFDRILRKLAQQLGQTLFAIGTKGHAPTDAYFDGHISGEFMGRAGSQTGHYDLMFNNNKGSTVSPYSLYGLNSIHTQDLIHQGYLDTDILVAGKSSLLTTGTNSYSVRINALRNQTTKIESKGKSKEIQITNIVKIPITVDRNSAGDIAYPEGSMTASQHFLIEYKNSKGYDELSPLESEGVSKGVLISHIINSDGLDASNNLASAVIDIESATPFPDGERVATDGTYYNGREINDWLDDFNDNEHTLESTSSLPSDFFVDSNIDVNRSKFTPVTRPSTDSWKLNDTHIGVFIDNIEQDYADIRVYRNYWSEPITQSVRVDGVGYIGENFTIQDGAVFEIGSDAEVPETSIFTIISGTQMIVQANSTLKLSDNSELIVEDGANIIFEAGSNLSIEGNAKVTGKITLSSYSSTKLLENSSLTINGVLYLEGSAKINAQAGSSLIIDEFSTLRTLVEPDYSEFTLGNYIEMTGSNWKGIICKPNSYVVLKRTKISGAETAISGSPSGLTTIDGSSCIIEQCEFTNCESGINLIASRNSQIINNSFTGLDTGTGTGIKLTQSNGDILGNDIKNFRNGIVVVSGSPYVSNNIITNNKFSGFYATGLNTYPQLIDTLSTDPALNNTIANNGEVIDGLIPSYRYPAQVIVRYPSSVYLDYGRNNIYSLYREIPCVSTASLIPAGQISIIRPIFARYNYWGSPNVTDDFFLTSEERSINYDSCSTRPFGSEPLYSPFPESDSKSWKLLQKALKAEFDEKYSKAIHSYEKIIDKYPDSEETYIAFVRLPDIYNYEGLSSDPLMVLYDERLASDDETVNKKFFKEMKVATHIKDHKYKDAIITSEEMRLEAESEEEEILCDIDIAIASMMLNSESNTKDGDTFWDSFNKINKYLEMLTQTKDGKSNLTLLPTEIKLHNNYPNPFNPVTTIKYDLPNEANVKMNIYNAMGAKVDQLVNGNVVAGYHTVSFDASKFSNGLYYYTLEINNKVKAVKKMLFLK